MVGVRDKCLWFIVDGDQGASFLDNGKSYEELLAVGIFSVTVRSIKCVVVFLYSLIVHRTNPLFQTKTGRCCWNELS